jgi:glycosyltransferase involved in cell wall biosynthesis
LVAVVIRTKDRPLLLRRALRSVIEQSFDDWQIILVNDGGAKGPVDDTVAAHAEQLQNRISTIHHDRPKGMEAASNVGVAASRSDYLAIHDDDDSWHQDFLRETVEFMRRSKVAGLGGVVSRTLRIVERIDADQVIELRREPFNEWLNAVTLYRMLSGNSFPNLSFLFERSAYDKVGGFREDLPVLGDWEFNIRFLQSYDIGVIPKALAYYHHRVTTQGGSYGNTVISGLHMHQYYDAALQNEWLRADLAKGKLGIGLLTALARSQELALTSLRRRETLFSYLKDRIYNLVVMRTGWHK